MQNTENMQNRENILDPVRVHGGVLISPVGIHKKKFSITIDAFPSLLSPMCIIWYRNATCACFASVPCNRWIHPKCTHAEGC